MALPHGPVGASASAYQSSPKVEGLPNFSMKTVTQRLRKAFQAIEPLCGFTGLPSFADARLSWRFRTSHVDESCHASNVAGQRRAGSGFPKSSHALPFASFHKTGWP